MTPHTAEIIQLPDPDTVAERLATDLVHRLAAVQRTGRVPSVVLTGGTVARKVHAAVPQAGEGLLDWAGVEFWWGDERYVPAADPERNAGQTWEDMLRHLPVDRRRVHEMAPSDGEYADVGSAASAYAHDLRRALEGRGPGEPWFDVLMLGIGPDAHCASLFPGREELHSSAYVLPVHDSPKPPPTRISLGMQTLRRAERVMFVATGSEKAEAVAASVHGEDVMLAPAAGPRGLESTTWYLDEEAAGEV